VTNTIQEQQQERAVAASLRAEGAARGVRISVPATSERALERRKRLSTPHLAMEIVAFYQSPLQRETWE
jgi:hypothetical protein